MDRDKFRNFIAPKDRLIKHQKEHLPGKLGAMEYFLDLRSRHSPTGVRQQPRLGVATASYSLFLPKFGKYTAEGIWYCIWDFQTKGKSSIWLTLRMQISTGATPMRSTHIWQFKEDWWPGSLLYEYPITRQLNPIGYRSQMDEDYAGFWGRSFGILAQNWRKRGSNLEGKVKNCSKKYI